MSKGHRSTSLKETLPGLGHVMTQFAPYLRPYRLELGGGIFALVLATAMKLLEPWPLKFVVDSVLHPGRTGLGIPPTLNLGFVTFDLSQPQVLVGVCAVSLFLVISFKALFQYLSTLVFSTVGNKVMTELRGKLFGHLQGLSLDFHDRARAGDLTLRLVGDVGVLKETAITAALPLMANVLVLVGMIGIMLWLDWQLALIAFVPLPVLWLATGHVSKKIQRASRDQRKREGTLASTVAEAMSGMRIVQALGLEGAVARAFGSANGKSLSTGLKAGRLSAGLERLVDVLVGVATALVLWFGAFAVLDGRMTAGDLLVFLTYLKNTFRPMREYAKYSGRLAKATAAAERVFYILDIKPTVAEKPNAQTAPSLSGDIRFRDVSFGYQQDSIASGTAVPLTLDRLDLTIPAGQRVAIAGPSGAGKSTLVNLLLRLRDPVAGKVEINGIDIADVTLASLRSQISFVPQDTLLFSMTVAENIALGAGREVTREEIVAAARLAQAEDFVNALPNGLDHEVRERGGNFSAGQRQRLSIARAALRQAPILILDEPTTGLDSTNEAAIRNAIDALSRGRTTLIVTHDLALARRCDRVLVVADGGIAEDGPPESLIAADGRFAAMLRLQQGLASQRPSRDMARAV